MVNYSASTLDLVFGALSNPLRRQILQALADGAASVKDLARPFQISLPGFMKHIGILEDAGLVRTEKRGRVRTCRLNAAPMMAAADWLTFYESFWEGQFDGLADFLEAHDDARNP